ncbi:MULTISPECIES: isoprenylcysteine carboxylmethyltransferase family protein [unclassified Agrobacterium]|uniref:methyltransferase family protein n=1 Tax=unclassified Agrobacterium TaxID=2632611 RepID=UPI0024489B6A|nr:MULTISPECIES: isoprenylcysteine carboxylmethyltransferase family protein [unclassified Agrobacterium]MDH0616002.1 isoprenylcysteine carboxylmethyltransferase family protein [Agrobacterium sp. GD03872]MDH0697707.1 isoprenylcysteine carboxylmethyltransferase family protein [Agrobacterium sp. GD03871]MDH1061202.1 isoprenylcysteine carboxylmethyltransferase family protein [Agrobacterium sp. GD03992]MDH2212718.1 isoprenylcysteine carboxylmethyltransferase family protein [Agrobacterium sp. GD03643
MIDIISVLAVWAYIAGFLLLTARLAKRSQQPVWLFTKGGERQTAPALLFRLAFFLGALLPLVTLWLEPQRSIWLLDRRDPGAAISILGMATVLAGSLIALYAQHYMGKSWRIGAAEGHLGAIVDTGPFGLSRNPVFVGQMLLFAGLVLVFPSVLQLAVALALTVAVILQVKIEERVLAKELGPAYDAYRRRVRRWF